MPFPIGSLHVVKPRDRDGAAREDTRPRLVTSMGVEIARGEDPGRKAVGPPPR